MKVKSNQNEIVKRKDLNAAVITIRKDVDDAVDAILTGVDELFREQDKRNEAKFATKEDLELTKTEVKTEIRFLKEDIEGLKADLSTTPTREEFNKLQVKVDNLSS